MKQMRTLLLVMAVMAVMVGSASAAIIIDNEDATGYSSVASAGVWAGAVGEYNANYEYGAVATFRATYSFAGLENGTYDVYATWSKNDLHADAVRFTMTPVGGSQVIATANMRIDPASDLTLVDNESESVGFQLLSTVTVSGGAVNVVLDGTQATVGGYFVADAVALVAVPEPATLGLLCIGGLAGLLKKRR